MEVSIQKDSSIKLKSKAITLVMNPSADSDAEVILLTNGKSIGGSTAKLVIYGPGEYEVGGMRIAGNYLKEEVYYTVEADSTKILIINASALSLLKEEDDYNAFLINANQDIQEQSFSSFSSQLYILYGDAAHVKIPEDALSKTSKINLKKKDESIGSVVLLV